MEKFVIRLDKCRYKRGLLDKYLYKLFNNILVTWETIRVLHLTASGG